MNLNQKQSEAKNKINGIITALNGELAEIAFTGNGIKKMNIRIAPVRKV